MAALGRCICEIDGMAEGQVWADPPRHPILKSYGWRQIVLPLIHEVTNRDGTLVCSFCKHVGGKMCIACGTVGVGVAKQLARGEQTFAWEERMTGVGVAQIMKT